MKSGQGVLKRKSDRCWRTIFASQVTSSLKYRPVKPSEKKLFLMQLLKLSLASLVSAHGSAEVENYERQVYKSFMTCKRLFHEEYCLIKLFNDSYFWAWNKIVCTDLMMLIAWGKIMVRVWLWQLKSIKEKLKWAFSTPARRKVKVSEEVQLAVWLYYCSNTQSVITSTWSVKYSIKMMLF